jgi:hypothetical protein
MNKKNIMEEALHRYQRYLSQSDTEDTLLHKNFKENLAHIEPDQKLIKKIQSKVNATSSIIGSSLFITGFLIARLTLPVAVGVKGVEEKSYIEELPTKIIEISTHEEFKKIITLAINKEISLEYKSNNNITQLYIHGLEQKKNKGFKKLLNLDNNYEGPLTIIVME